MQRIPVATRVACWSLLLLLLVPAVATAQWTHWRGPQQNGVSDATGLISSWSKDGANLIWRRDFTGRSTPVLVDGRVCANGRAGEDILRQEVVACWDAGTGEPLWERRFNVYHTAVPWNRVGWGALAADSETGHVYAQFVNGRFVAFAPDGDIAWEWRLHEDFGRFSGYGGRTNTPVVDEDRVITHVISASWGSNRGGGDRWVAFDKRTGEILWVSEKGSRLKDLNTYSTPSVAEIDGRRQLIGGGADGWLYGLDVRTGEQIWRFHLSQRGLNSSPVVDGTKLYAAHSEENIDTGVMGRVVGIELAGASGDITKTGEMWRIEELQAGFVSPSVKDGVVYIADNSANLFALDGKTGEEHWEVNYGTVGKGSPVLADGRIYLTEVNGHVVVIDPKKAEVTSNVELEMPDGRYAEIYSSIAIGYGRLYFTTEEGIYSLGDPSAPFDASAGALAANPKPEMAPAGAKAATFQVIPNAVVTTHDQPVDFRVHAFDAQGHPLGEVEGATWSLSGVAGKIDADGVASFDGSKITATVNATVTAKKGGMEGTADVRVAGPLPWSWDFEDVPVGKPPHGWLGVGKGAQAHDLDGAKVLRQPKAPRGAPRATILAGPSSMTGYEVQADVKAGYKRKRTRSNGTVVFSGASDAGIVNNGYTMDLQGAQQRLQIQSWTSERRMRQVFPFEWDLDSWYTLKMRVDFEGEGDARKAIIRGKAWKRGDSEPAGWTVEVEDPLPIDSGSPGLYTFAPEETFFDNFSVTVAR
ncbi:MAG: PQQ-binding-like beta-propeller repeat protein [Acidobacteriota bacterium]